MFEPNSNNTNSLLLQEPSSTQRKPHETTEQPVHPSSQQAEDIYIFFINTVFFLGL